MADPYASQVPEFSSPPASQPAPSGNAGGGNKAAQLGFVVWLKSLDGILRIAGVFLTLLCFAIASSQDGFDKEASFEFVVAAGVLAWLWELAVIATRALGMQGNIAQWPLIQFAMDSLMFFFLFVAGIAGAVQCDEKRGGKKLCEYDGTSDIKGGIAFAFLSSFLFIAHVFFSFKAYKA